MDRNIKMRFNTHQDLEVLIDKLLNSRLAKFANPQNMYYICTLSKDM